MDRIDISSIRVVDRGGIDFTNRNKVRFHFDVLVFSIITFIIIFLCLSFSFTSDDETNTSLFYSTYLSLSSSFFCVLTMHMTMKLINTMNLSNDISHSFARGFDDFDVTWPPSTNITSINDDK